MEKIPLKKAIDIMKFKDSNGNPSVFDIGVYTLNKNSKTGGTYKVYQGVSLSIPKKTTNKKLSSAKELELLKLAPKRKRKPNHKKNRTLNIDVPGVSHPVTIHYRLITMFNGKKVHY